MENKKSLNSISLIIGICLLIILAVLLLALFSLRTENHLFKVILISDLEFAEISIDSQRAEGYYDLASLAYEKGDFNSAEQNCQLARIYFSQEAQGYRRLRSQLRSYEISHPLIDLYIEELNEQIKIAENSYEACEHFESAARHYSNNDYEEGNAEIEEVNKKIELRDDAVRRYNSLLEDFRIVLSNMIDA